MPSCLLHAQACMAMVSVYTSWPAGPRASNCCTWVLPRHRHAHVKQVDLVCRRACCCSRSGLTGTWQTEVVGLYITMHEALVVQTTQRLCVGGKGWQHAYVLALRLCSVSCTDAICPEARRAARRVITCIMPSAWLMNSVMLVRYACCTTARMRRLGPSSCMTR